MRRLGRAVQRRPGRHAVIVGRRAIFVDVVAQVNDSVQPLQLRQGVIGVEQPARVKLARHDPQRQLGRRSFRQGSHPADRRDDLARDEAVEIVLARRQPLAVQVMLDGEIPLGRRLEARRAANDVAEVRIARDLQHHGHLAARRLARGNARPEDGGASVGIAAGHPMQEGRPGPWRRLGPGRATRPPPPSGPEDCGDPVSSSGPQSFSLNVRPYDAGRPAMKVGMPRPSPVLPASLMYSSSRMLSPKASTPQFAPCGV